MWHSQYTNECKYFGRYKFVKRDGRAVDIDASARGAAFFAGIGAGIWTQETLPEIVLKDTVEPVWEESENLMEEYKHWEDSIKRTLKWSEMEFDDTEDADCLNPNMI